jgi:uncharacterized protein
MDVIQTDVFDWDSGNISKNYKKHNVTWAEAEEVFKNVPIVFFDDEKYSELEKRYIVFGKSNRQRLLVMSITIRINKIRIISIRDQNKKEKSIYKKYEK